MYEIRDLTQMGVNKEDAQMHFNGVDVVLPNQQLLLYPGRKFSDGTRQWLIQMAHPTAHSFITLAKVRGSRDQAETKLRTFIAPKDKSK